jgi:hypothetical protein
MDNSPVLLDPPAIDGSPAQAFASHKTRASAIAREYANRHPLEYIGWVVGDHEYNQDDVKKGLAPTWSGKLGEDQSIELIAHFQAASDDPEFKVQEERSITLAPKTLRKLNPGDGQVGTSKDYDMALKGLMVIAYRYRKLLSDDDRNFILQKLVPDYLSGGHDYSIESHTFLGFSYPETENHLLMIESSRYLVNQLLFSRTGDGKYDNVNNGLTKWLLGDMQTIAKHDFLEFSARPYARMSLHALFNLYEFAGDVSIRDAAQMLLDYTMVKFAVSSNRQRRVCPFRRHQHQINHAANQYNDLMIESGDQISNFFLMYSGPTDTNGNPGNLYPGGLTYNAVIAGPSSYRPPPAAYILAMKRDGPAFQHRFYHGSRPKLIPEADVADGGVEIYYSSPSFLLTAGGMFLNSGYRFDEISGGSKRAWEETARAQATTLLPTKAEVVFADLIRFEPYPDNLDDPYAVDPNGTSFHATAVNIGVHSGFACGAHLRPSEKGTFRESSSNSPALAVRPGNPGEPDDPGNLFLGWKGSGNPDLSVANVYATKKLGIDGVERLEGKVIPGDKSEEAPALAFHDGRLFMAWKDASNDTLNLMFSDDNGATFHGKKTFLEATSHKAPALASHAGSLFLAWTGRGEGKLNVAKVTLVGNTAGGFGIEGFEPWVPLGDTSDQAPALELGTVPAGMGVNKSADPFQILCF